jgi:hypothetical protein
LAAVYAADRPLPTRPMIDAMFTMAPPPAAAMAGSSARME